MNSPTEIKKIEDLLSLYYEGKTSWVQEKTLRDFFRHAQAEELQESLREDATVFETLDDINSYEAEAKIPENLRDAMERMAAVCRNGNSVGRRLKWLYITAATAAACIAGLVLLPFVSMPEGEVSEIACFKEPQAKDSITVSPSSIESTSVAYTQYVTTECTPDTITETKTSSTPDKNPDTEDDGYREVTDPDEARRILEHSLGLVISSIHDSKAATCEMECAMTKLAVVTLKLQWSGEEALRE